MTFGRRMFVWGAPQGATNRLYRDGTFTDVSEQAGLHSAGRASGVCEISKLS